MTSLKWDASKSAARNAKEKLPELAGLFFAKGDEAAGPSTPVPAIHRFRLVTKRFRYTLDLFRDYYGPSLKPRIESLRNLQQLLGAVSDCSATEKLLNERKDLSESEHARLQEKLDRIAQVRVARFRAEWRKNYSPPARQRSWTIYLRRARLR